jgi:hypothetical protein
LIDTQLSCHSGAGALRNSRGASDLLKVDEVTAASRQIAGDRLRGKAATPPDEGADKRDRQLARLILRTASPVNDATSPKQSPAES